MMTPSRMSLLATRFATLRNQGRQSENGFTLIEMLVVILLLGIVGTVAATVLINATRTAADFNNPEDCFNQGDTAEVLCQIQMRATNVKGTNETHSVTGTMVMPFHKTQEVVAFDRTVVQPYVSPNLPATLVWQVGTFQNGDVCVVGYDLSDPTSKFTHEKPFVYSPTFGVNSGGIGCGTWEAGTFVWDNDPTVVKPARVFGSNAPEPVRVVDKNGNVINGIIDATREGQSIYVFVTKEFATLTNGATHGYITVDATYTCSNGFSKTERMQIDVMTEDPNATWRGNLFTYGGDDIEAPSCNPTDVSLTAVTDATWTVGETESFSFSGTV